MTTSRYRMIRWCHLSNTPGTTPHCLVMVAILLNILYLNNILEIQLKLSLPHAVRGQIVKIIEQKSYRQLFIYLPGLETV